ncbi:MAG: dihydrodipicolinate synthase family protein [Verrucomicrobia bacterium]|nr:dihydrodipicolinate synthase family protein [Verrucomicrobiota bacterium]
MTTLDQVPQNERVTNSSRLPRPLRGIVPPMVTPLLDRDTLDLAGLERLIEHLLAGGVHGLFVLGTTGEAPSLSHRLRRELITRACRQVRQRIPVLVGITDTSFVESIEIARHAADAGVQACVTSAPYYFPAGQPELLEYTQHLVRELPLPLFLYNMPMMTKTPFELDTIARLRDEEKIIGVKDSGGDFDYLQKLVKLSRARTDWSVLVGPEHLLADAIRCGGHGGVNGGAHLCPSLFVQLYEAAVRGDAARVGELQQRVVQLGQIYKVGRHASAVIKGIKCSLALMGICDDFVAEPLARFLPPERQRVRAILDSLEWLTPPSVAR